MSELSDFTYAALITITLPGDGESITVPVKLSPADSVPIEGERKLLADCTIADLQRYAIELEKDVWDAYEAISLPALDEDEAVAVEVVLGSDPNQLVEEWSRQALLLPDLDENQVSAPADEEDLVSNDFDEKEELLLVPDELTEPEAPIEDDDTESDEAAETINADVAVAETELVYPEIEEEASPRPDPSVPEIIPSKARVRVAGMQLPLGHPTWAAVDILVDEPALRATQAHALSSLKREVAGVLIGPRPEKQPDGRYLVHIIDTIVAKHTVMQGASVTYTPESWRYLNDTLMERYPDDTVVMAGWYHTHPGFGVFLSGFEKSILDI